MYGRLMPFESVYFASRAALIVRPLTFVQRLTIYGAFTSLLERTRTAFGFNPCGTADFFLVFKDPFFTLLRWPHNKHFRGGRNARAAFSSLLAFFFFAVR